MGTSAAVEVHFYDEHGQLLTHVNVSLFSGEAGAKLGPQANGVYEIPAVAGDKVTFMVSGQGIRYSSTDVVIPIDLQGALDVVLQASGAGGSSCEEAQEVEIGTTVSGDTGLDGVADDPGFCGTSITAPGVWFAVNGTGETLTASTCDQADFDTKINVYCLDCEDLVCVDGNDDLTCSGFTSEISWCSEPGASYGVFVQGFDGATGAFDLTISGAGDSCSVGSGVSCSPPQPVGACCNCLNRPFNCTIGTSEECLALGGDWTDSPRCEILPFVCDDGQAIPDNQFPDYVSASFTVAGGPATITDVNVGVVYTHTWIGDLNFDVEHPNGTRITLWPSICDGAQFQGIDTEFDDEGTAQFCNQDGPTPAPDDGNGNIIPLGGVPLAVYDGSNSNGEWTLFSADDFAGDTGTLDLFYARFNNEPPIGRCDFVYDDPFVSLCHCPPGLGGSNCHTLSLVGNVADAHLSNHGLDYLGDCFELEASAQGMSAEGQQASESVEVDSSAGTHDPGVDHPVRRRIR